MRVRRPLRMVTTVATVTLALAACGGSGPANLPGPPKTSSPVPTAVGAGEGQLNLVAWAGYAENGSTDKAVDWVTPFTASTGCKVNVKIGNTSDEMVTLMNTGQYDGLSASGDAALRLIYGGDVAPVIISLVPNYATIADFLKLRPWNSVNGVAYGIPHGWGANLLLFNKDVVKPEPDSWSVVFDPASPYKGKVTAYDSPIYLADAALYLKATRPGLKITNPYELDDAQFAAAVDLLKQQKGLIGEYWSDYTKAVSAIESKNTVLGTSWQVIANMVQADKKVNTGTLLPKEGATGWSDTWMISSTAKHPNCMYKWMDWIVSPKINAQVAEYFGEAPAQTKACQYTRDKTFCETYHALDKPYADRIAYWTTPRSNCADDRGAICKDYAAWAQAWTAIKG